MTDRELDLHAPENASHIQQVRGYIEHDPLPGYQHAPESAREAFQDMKFGLRIHWGLYSQWHLKGESWPFLRMPYERRQAYQQIYRSFNPVNFNAAEWMDFFRRAGLKCFAITTKHHEGFSLWDTQTRVRRRMNWTGSGGPRIEECDLAYSVMESPFRRDILKELTDAAHQAGIKIDFYFSHPDWYDADFRPYAYHPLQTPDVALHPEDYGSPSYPASLRKRIRHVVMAEERTPEETARMVQRHRAQIVELLSNFGKIDMLCLDMWLGKDVWPELRETVRLARSIQPEIMLRIRGIGNYGDYYTPEGFVPGDKSNTDMPWMVIYPLARSFSYDPIGFFHKGPAWIIRNLASCVAKGGNFMVGIGPDKTGRFHPRAVSDLEAAGDWLRVNGEAIYATRPYEPWHEGETTLFTRSKDRNSIYAICLRWPGRELRLRSIPAQKELTVHFLGYQNPLQWSVQGEELVIAIPEELQRPANRPCKHAYVFKFALTGDLEQRLE